MAYALVGTIGAVSQGASGAAVTPAYGTGESRTANNLLQLWVVSQGSATLPSAPTGWSIGKQQAGTTCSSSIFYKIAAGSDAAPTVAAVTSSVLSCQLAEFSGNKTSTPLDQTGGVAGITSTQTATFGGTDTGSGELIVAAIGNFYNSSTGTKTLSATSNNATLTSTTNQGSTGTTIYLMVYGFTTSNSSADNIVATFSTTHETGCAIAGCSFLLPPPVALTSAISPSLSVVTTNRETVQEYVNI